jgi:hypothetical protein
MIARLVSREIQLPFTVTIAKRGRSGAAAMPLLLNAKRIMSLEMSAHPREASSVKSHTHTARELVVHLDVESTISI